MLCVALGVALSVALSANVSIPTMPLSMRVGPPTTQVSVPWLTLTLNHRPGRRAWAPRTSAPPCSPLRASPTRPAVTSCRSGSAIASVSTRAQTQPPPPPPTPTPQLQPQERRVRRERWPESWRGWGTGRRTRRRQRRRCAWSIPPVRGNQQARPATYPRARPDIHPEALQRHRCCARVQYPSRRRDSSSRYLSRATPARQMVAFRRAVAFPLRAWQARSSLPLRSLRPPWCVLS